jgi:hypothetical protein
MRCGLELIGSRQKTPSPVKGARASVTSLGPSVVARSAGGSGASGYVVLELLISPPRPSASSSMSEAGNGRCMVGAATGTSSCSVEHVGIVVSGRATAAMDNGTITEMRPGDVFYIAPGHDSWVVGEEPYMSLHFLGADRYADRH